MVVGEMVVTNPKATAFWARRRMGKSIMAFRRRATRDGDQVGRLQTRKSAPPVLLHFVVQDRLDSSLGKALLHVGDCCLTHIEGIGQFGTTPSLGGFEQDTSTGEDTGVGF